MIREVKFESQDRRMKQILAALNKHGIKDIEEANQICESYGIDPYMECESTQMICFENAKWAYVVGTAIALKEKAKDAVEAAEYIGEGLQAFCIPGSVADDRKVGIGHGRLAARLLSPETNASHSSQVTRALLLPKVLLRLHRWLTKAVLPTNLCVVSSTASARTLL